MDILFGTKNPAGAGSFILPCNEEAVHLGQKLLGLVQYEINHCHSLTPLYTHCQ